MHYEIRGPTIDLDLKRPMFGIVESLCPDSTFDQLNTDLGELGDRLGDALNQWHTRA